jgi:hypothetical protein
MPFLGVKVHAVEFCRVGIAHKMTTNRTIASVNYRSNTIDCSSGDSTTEDGVRASIVFTRLGCEIRSDHFIDQSLRLCLIGAIVFSIGLKLLEPLDRESGCFRDCF